LPHAWITTFIPFYSVHLTHFAYKDLTQSATLSDARVTEQLTNNLAQVVYEYGDGLMLGDWKRTGLGDLNILVESLFNFPQPRAILKNVEINGRVGFTVPTGLKTDEDRLLEVPFGYDGAVGLLFGGGINVLLGCNFKAGLDVQLLHLFGNSRIRRITTFAEQSELLRLAKTKAYKDYGLTQRFNLFIQGYHLYQGLSILTGYQYLKHGRDTLQLYSCDYNNNIANQSQNLYEWTAHSVEINIHYDFVPLHNGYAPQASLFFQLPFNGKRSLLFTTIGITGAIDF
jgi:hypothetical protein